MDEKITTRLSKGLSMGSIGTVSYTTMTVGSGHLTSPKLSKLFVTNWPLQWVPLWVPKGTKAKRSQG